MQKISNIFITLVLAFFIGLMNQVILATIDISILELKFLFVIPGSIIIGSIVMYISGIHFKKVNIEYPMYQKIILAVIVTSVILISSYYFNFLHTSIDDQGQLTYSLNGDHISNYEYNGKQLNFYEYTKFRILESESNISIRGNRSNVFSFSSKTWNLISLNITVFGLFGAVLSGYLIMVPKKIYFDSYYESLSGLESYPNEKKMIFEHGKQKITNLIKEDKLDISYSEVALSSIEELAIKSIHEKDLNSNFLDLHLMQLISKLKKVTSKDPEYKQIYLEEFADKIEQLKKYGEKNGISNYVNEIISKYSL